MRRPSRRSKDEGTLRELVRVGCELHDGCVLLKKGLGTEDYPYATGVERHPAPPLDKTTMVGVVKHQECLAQGAAAAPLGRAKLRASRTYSSSRRHRCHSRGSPSVLEDELSHAPSDPSTPSETEPVRRLRRQLARTTRQARGHGRGHTRDHVCHDCSDLEPRAPPTWFLPFHST